MGQKEVDWVTHRCAHGSCYRLATFDDIHERYGDRYNWTVLSEGLEY